MKSAESVGYNPMKESQGFATCMTFSGPNYTMFFGFLGTLRSELESGAKNGSLSLIKPYNEGLQMQAQGPDVALGQSVSDPQPASPYAASFLPT